MRRICSVGEVGQERKKETSGIAARLGNESTRRAEWTVVAAEPSRLVRAQPGQWPGAVHVWIPSPPCLPAAGSFVFNTSRQWRDCMRWITREGLGRLKTRRAAEFWMTCRGLEGVWPRRESQQPRQEMTKLEQRAGHSLWLRGGGRCLMSCW